MLNIGVLVSGSGSNLQAIIDAVEAGSLRCAIKVVVSNRPGAFAVERAKRHGIPVEIITRDEFPDRETYDEELARRLKAHGAGLVVMAGFMRLITGRMLDAFPMRIINIHPSLLPAFPGLDVQKCDRTRGQVSAARSTCRCRVDSGPIMYKPLFR